MLCMEQLLPANTYGAQPQATPGSTFLRYSTFSASLNVLEDLKEYMGVTPYRLGVLLGMEHPHMPYEWFRGRKRPSQDNCIKMMKLLVMVNYQGLRLPFVDSINWATGEIRYKGRGDDKGNSRVPTSQREIPKGNSGYGVPMADILD